MREFDHEGNREWEREKSCMLMACECIYVRVNREREIENNMLSGSVHSSVRVCEHMYDRICVRKINRDHER